MDYDTEVNRLAPFLKLTASTPEVQQVVDSSRPGVAEGQQGLHFYKGKIGRFRETYSGDEQAVVNEKLRHYLERMGYPI